MVQQTGSVLVVDHEPTIGDLLVEILTDEGYVAHTVPEGAAALGAIARHSPALLLLDVGHTGKRGSEVFERVREAPLATMSIVTMTTAALDAAPLLALGAVECLTKPFDLDMLLACVARYAQPLAAEPASLALSALAVASN